MRSRATPEVPVFLFACACGWQGDRLAETRQTHAPCPSCGGSAAKRFSPPRMLTIRVVGVESMTPGELRLARENKASLEARASEVHSGEITLRSKSTVPRELRPEIPKRLH